MMRLAIALLGLLTMTACADDVAPVHDMAVTADLAPRGSCDATVDVSHICNTSSAPGFCFYRETNMACVLCVPAGCVGTLDSGDQGTYDSICVTSCNDCQPATPSACYVK
jgi:hypothetical protein